MSHRGGERAPVKRSVSFVVRREGAASPILLVRRPDDDEELPGVWGLPAGSLLPGEGWEEAVRRAGNEKLGIDLEAGRMLREGTTERRDYTLHMRLFEARITGGEPALPQGQPPEPSRSHEALARSTRHPHPDRRITRYREWRWGSAEQLQPAAEKGSLCSRLFLEVEGGRDG